MSTITLKGNPVSTVGALPETGALAPDFTVVRGDLSEATLANYRGKRLILNIFPSLDTAPCAMSVRRFNEEAARLKETVVLCVSADLPFAAKRFCVTEGLENVETGSVFRSTEFGQAYGVTMTSGPLKGLLSRAVVVIDGEGRVRYTQQVPEIGNEPDYAHVLSAL